MARTLEPDDEVHRWASVWLGPEQVTLPFHARYSAYVMFFALAALNFVIVGITPLAVGPVPIWEFAYALLVTSVLMSAVDHDRPVHAVVLTVAREHLRRHHRPRVARYAPRARVKITRNPI